MRDNMAANEDVIKKDYLVKRAQLKSFFTKENYKSRWFELTEFVLRYSDGSPENGVGRVKGQIQLKNILAVEEADQEPLGCRPFAFQVVYKGEEKSVLYIIAKNELQRAEWITSIRQACLSAGALMSSMYHPGIWLKSNKYSCCDSINKRSDGCKTARNGTPSNTGSSFASVNASSLRGCYSPPTATGGQQIGASFLRPLPPTPPNDGYDEDDDIDEHHNTNSKLYQQNKQEFKKVLALFEYHATEQGDLDLVKGEEYDILCDADPQSSWWQARNKFGKTGYVPANYVQLVNGICLDQYDWFYAKMSRMQSEELLHRDGREGVFLVRDSSQKDMFTLSVFTKAAGLDKSLVKHYHIKQNDDGEYFLADKHAFSTIPELIYYHRHNCAGLIVRLRFPAGDKNSFKPTCGLGHELKEIDIDLIDIKEELGRGQFGRVHRGVYSGRVEVAVKTMTEGSMLEEDFIEEARTMTKLQHDNLVMLYGVCTKKHPVRIITEYLKNGALLMYLRRNKVRLLPNTEKLIDMCIQVTSGMDYLEAAGIIHRDLAARNCLVDEKGSVKVGDFGLARYVLDNEYMSSTGTKFPVRWSSPEVLNFNKFSSKSDVWAFGILMWEIFTGGETPYGKMKNIDVVSKICNGTLRPKRPDHCPDVVFRITEECWETSPDDRPTFNNLYQELKDLLKDGDYEDDGPGRTS